MRIRLGTIAATGLATLVAALAGSATAAEGGFGIVEAGSSLFPDQAYVLTLDQRRQLTSSDVKVIENGSPVTDVTIRSAAGTSGIGTVLLIDASNSMRTTVDQAMVAARAFAKRNPGQPMSVVTFNAKPTIALAFSTDQKQVNRALARVPKLAEGTRIYDALAAAVAQIRDSGLGAGRVVLLSDGADVGSQTSRDAVLRQLNDERIRVYTVGIASPDFVPEELESIASDTEAAYAEAGSGSQLKGIYDDLGYKLSNEYLLVYRSLAGAGKDIDVKVTVAGLGTQVAEYRTPTAGTGTPYEKPFLDKLLQSWLLMLLVVVLVMALVVYAMQTLLRLRTNRRLRRRLGDFVTLPEEERAQERREEVLALLALSRSGSWRDWRWFNAYEEDVDVADITTPARTIFIWSTLAGLVLAVLVGVLFGPVWALVGILVPLGARSEVSRRANAIRRKFAEQLPDSLEVMASALRAGHSLVGSMSVVIDESPDPAKREFRRVVTDEQLGVHLDDALEVTARRMRNTDLDQVALVAMLQREAGSNMAEVLDQVIANVRARMELRRLVRVLTAQGRLARWILTAIPIFLLIFLLVVNPDHLEPLFHETLGIVALIASGCMVVAGSLVIKKLVDIEI